MPFMIVKIHDKNTIKACQTYSKITHIPEPNITPIITLEDVLLGYTKRKNS